MTQAVKAGDKLRIHYTGRLDDGTVFDRSEERGPLEFTIGRGEVIAGLDRGLIGMEVGETRALSVPAEDAYGPRDEDRVQTVPREVIPDNIPTAPGTRLNMATRDGQTVPVTVTDATDSEIVLDANHPLAGKALNFDVTLVEIA